MANLLGQLDGHITSLCGIDNLSRVGLLVPDRSVRLRRRFCAAEVRPPTVRGTSLLNHLLRRHSRAV